MIEEPSETGAASHSDYLDVFKSILELNLAHCDVEVCLASIQQDQAVPLFMSIELSTEVNETFRNIVKSTLVHYAKEWYKHDLIVRSYAVESKTDDYEFEYLHLVDHDSIARQIEPLSSLQDLGTFREEPWFVEGLRFYVIVVKPLDGEPVYFYRSYTPKKLLSQSSFFGIRRGANEYNRVDEPIFLFDQHIDCFSRGNHLFILKKENFHYIFRFLEEVIKTAKQTLARIESHIPIVNFAEFARSCERNSTKMRKLKNIATQPYLDSITMADIKKAIAAHNLNIQIVTVNGQEMLRYDPTEQYGILKLLDDDYLQSIMTNKSYEATGKRGRSEETSTHKD